MLISLRLVDNTAHAFQRRPNFVAILEGVERWLAREGFLYLSVDGISPEGLAQLIDEGCDPWHLIP
jgi:hypothetical protein